MWSTLRCDLPLPAAVTPETDASAAPDTGQGAGGENPVRGFWRSRFSPWFIRKLWDDNAEAGSVNAIQTLVLSVNSATKEVGNQAHNQQSLAKVPLGFAFTLGYKGLKNVYARAGGQA